MSTCARCRSSLASGALACAKCGARQIAAGDLHDQYGMLDLGGLDPAGAAGPALETDDVAPAARKRASSTTGSRRAHPASRSGPLGGAPDRPAQGSRSSAQSGERRATSRSSGAMAAVDPARAGTKRSGAMPAIDPGRAAAQRTSATSRSGTMRAVQQAPAAARPAADPGQSYGRGMMLDDDPLNAAFDHGPGTAALELEHDEAAPASSREPRQPREDEAPPPAPETPGQVRARNIEQIAAYGPRPRSPLQQPLYWWSVMNRKRVLSEELTALSAQRKRADGQAQEALVSLAETLLAMREAPELSGLAKQFAALDDADDRVGHAAAEGQKRRDDAARELSRLQRDFTNAEAKAAPLKAREAELVARIDELKDRARRADVLRRKADADLEGLQRSKGGAEPERWAAMSAERDARLGEVQTLGVQLRPLEDDLGELRRGLSVQMRAIATIQEERRAAAAGLERVQQSQRVSEGSARGARLQALLSLANTALKLGLHELVPDYADAVSDAAERADKKRQQEELHRAALNSYDHAAYNRGFAMLLGSSVLVFLSLAIAILF
jgi:hypothetical protein